MNCLVFDIGGTYTKYGVCDEHGCWSLDGAFPTPSDHFASLLDAMAKTYHDCRQVMGNTHGSPDGYGQINGIAVSSPGAVDSAAGIIHGISALDYIHEFPICSAISKAMDDLPVSIENDANCAALGELWMGAARGKKNIVFVVCGTGIGGAVIIDGNLYKGATMNGGEFGNYLVHREADGTRLTWSDFTIVKQARKYTVQTDRKINGKELMSLFLSGDMLASRLVDEFYEIMAIGCYNINFTLDTEMIIFGGGVSESEYLIPGIRRKLDELASYGRFGYLKPLLCTCTLGSRANLYGAMYHFLQSFPQSYHKTQWR